MLELINGGTKEYSMMGSKLVSSCLRLLGSLVGLFARVISLGLGRGGNVWLGGAGLVFWFIGVGAVNLFVLLVTIFEEFKVGLLVDFFFLVTSSQSP